MEISLNIKCTKCGEEANIQLQKNKSWEDFGFSIGDNINGDDFGTIRPNNYFKTKQTCPEEMHLICKKCGNTVPLTI